MKITKEHKGPYGTHSVASVPKIAGGAGSVTAFSLTFPKKLFAYKGKKHGYLLAKCANGHFLAQAEAKFSDGDQDRPGEDRPRLHAEGLTEQGRAFPSIDFDPTSREQIHAARGAAGLLLPYGAPAKGPTGLPVREAP